MHNINTIHNINSWYGPVIKSASMWRVPWCGVLVVHNTWRVSTARRRWKHWAFGRLGVAVSAALQSGCVSGWCPTQATVRSGVRWSSYRAFLRRARHRDNLHIFTYATVTKVNSISQFNHGRGPTQCSYVLISALSTLLLVCHIHSAASISNVISLCSCPGPSARVAVCVLAVSIFNNNSHIILYYIILYYYLYC